MPAKLPGIVCQVLNAIHIDAGTLCRTSSPMAGPTGLAVERTSTKKIIRSCEGHWDAHKSDCSGFVKAVAADLGVTISGLANEIVGKMESAPWVPLKSGLAAKEKADLGYFVLGGLKAEPNGHVVVVVAGPLDRGRYPTAYWGRLGSQGQRAKTVNWAWNAIDRDSVSYAYYSGVV
jgi:hypothetical protein